VNSNKGLSFAAVVLSVSHQHDCVYTALKGRGTSSHRQCPLQKETSKRGLSTRGFPHRVALTER